MCQLTQVYPDSCWNLFVCDFSGEISLTVSNLLCRLCDVVHSEKKLTLVFEYSDQDLKKYFDSCNGEIDPDIVKVMSLCLARSFPSHCVTHNF